MKVGHKLYEKFSSDVNRKTQAIAWKSIADDLKQKENIDVENVSKLKQNVTNWIRRATVSEIAWITSLVHIWTFLNSIYYFQAANDAAKQTGAGKQPKLTEFQEMCLAFVSSSKGSTAVNYIQTIEPSGTDKVVYHDSVLKDISNEIDVDNFDPDETFRFRSQSQPRKRKTHTQTAESEKGQSEPWKEKYFKSMLNNEEKFTEAGIRKAHLKSYNLLLRNISLEKSPIY